MATMISEVTSMRIVLLIAGLFIFNTTFAQFRYPTKEQAEILKSRILIVELFDEASDVEKETNANLKKYFQENWKFNEVVEFMSREKIAALYEINNEQYAVLRHELADKTIKGVSRENNGIRYRNTIAELTYYSLNARHLMESKFHEPYIPSEPQSLVVVVPLQYLYAN